MMWRVLLLPLSLLALFPTLALAQFGFFEQMFHGHQQQQQQQQQQPSSGSQWAAMADQSTSSSSSRVLLLQFPEIPDLIP